MQHFCGGCGRLGPAICVLCAMGLNFAAGPKVTMPDAKVAAGEAAQYAMEALEPDMPVPKSLPERTTMHVEEAGISASASLSFHLPTIWIPRKPRG